MNDRDINIIDALIKGWVRDLKHRDWNDEEVADMEKNVRETLGVPRREPDVHSS